MTADAREPVHAVEHEQEKVAAFEAQQPIMDRIREMGFARYAETLPRLPEAFDLEKHKVGEYLRPVLCMDERTVGGVHSAGSCILLSPEDLETYMRVAQPDAITSHNGCGAGKLYCRVHGLPEENSDKIARARAEEIAKQYSLPHVHLRVEQKFHSARVCYWDVTGRINNDPDSGLPEGFVISRAFMNKENCLKEAGTALDIIFGDHGYGRQAFSADNPFIITAVAQDENQLEEMKKEIAQLTHLYGDIVAIDGFILRLAE